MHNSWGRFGRGVPGEFCAIVVAADINNTASQGASLIGRGVLGRRCGGHKQALMGGLGGDIRGK